MLHMTKMEAVRDKWSAFYGVSFFCSQHQSIENSWLCMYLVQTRALEVQFPIG